ncbi:MAG: hypothetical protein ACFBRM_00445 [Pikeienuella sp.]
MKSASQITLTKAWWKKEAPDGLKKSASAFEKALDEYAKAEAGLEKGKPDQAARAFEAALSSLESAGKQVATEAKDLEKKEKDKKKKADLANTQAVMEKPLAKEIAAARSKIEEVSDAAPGDFVSAAAHAQFVRKWAGKIKRGSVSFAIGLPSADPADMRFNFHASKDGRSLASVLKSAAKAKKTTFGRAGALALAEDVGDEDATARTLCLDLEGPRIPGLAKRVRLMLKALGISQFGKVQVLEGGVEVDAADDDLSDEAPIDALDLEEGDPLEQQWKTRKAEAFPQIQAVLKSDRPDLEALKSLARKMAAAERAQDWAGALEALEVLIAPAKGAPPVTAAENERLERLLPDELIKTDLTLGDMKELFSKDYMVRLKDLPFKGVGDPTLKQLMREVDKGVAGPRRTEVMAALARIVGVPPTAEKLDVDYGRFVIVRKQQKVNGINSDKSVPALDEGKHPEFMASRGQFICGKVLGDAFGIHEVFAALLTPTGGLVGPGNWLIPGVVTAGHLAPDNPVALHGSVHDAAGYLLTFHGDGPGYNYRENKLELLSTKSPLSGQISGIVYWIGEAGDEFLIRRVEAVVLAVEKKLKAARTAVADAIDGLLSKALSTSRRAFETAQKISDRTEEAVLEVVDAIQEAQERVERTAVETLRAATRRCKSRMRDKAKRKFEAAWAYIRS